MAQSKVIEGTSEAIVVLQAGAFAGQKLRVIVEAEDSFLDDLPTPANTIRDAAQLEQLLLEGLASPVQKVPEESWEAKR